MLRAQGRCVSKPVGRPILAGHYAARHLGLAWLFTGPNLLQDSLGNHRRISALDDPTGFGTFGALRSSTHRSGYRLRPTTDHDHQDGIDLNFGPDTDPRSPHHWHRYKHITYMFGARYIGASDANEYTLWDGSNNNGWRGAGNEQIIVSNTAFEDEEFHVVSVRRNATKTSLWIDGVFLGEDDVASLGYGMRVRYDGNAGELELDSFTGVSETLGRSHQKIDDGWHGDIAFAFFFDVALPDAWIQYLGRHPYAVFVEESAPIWVPAAAAASTATTSLDGALQQQKTLLASIDAAVQQAKTQGTSLDGALATAQTALISADAALRKATTALASLDAAAQAAQTSTTSLDAAAQSTRTSTTSLDAAAAVARTRALSIEAALELARTATITLDGALEAPTTTTADLNAALQSAKTAQASLNAVLQAALTLSTGLDASLQGAGGAATRTISLDAALSKLATATASLDAALQSAATSTLSLNGALQSTATLSTAIDAALAATATISAGVDAVFSATMTLTAGINAAVMGAVSTTTSLDARLIAAAILGPSSSRRTWFALGREVRATQYDRRFIFQ